MLEVRKFSIVDEDCYYIAGRGTVFAFHEFYKDDFKIGEQVIINNKLYTITGIEARQGLVPLKGIGLLVREVKE